MSLLTQFTQTLPPDEAHIAAEVSAYFEWQVGRQVTAFRPTEDDDVDVRAYLLHLRVAGATREALAASVAGLQRFYTWATTERLIPTNPIAEVDFQRPLLSRDEVQRRRVALPADPAERELLHLRALNTLAHRLNRSVDLQSVLDTAIATLVEVMALKTAWIFLLPEVQNGLPGNAGDRPHDYDLATACGLPPGLELEDRRYLRQPPDCHCQRLLRSGRMTRAVNVVACTRLQDSARAGGDNRGLFFHASTPLIVSGKPLGLINVATEDWQFLTAADLQFLSTVAAQVAVSVERARLFDLAESRRARLEEELQMARAVQAGLLPDELPIIPGFDLAGHWQAAREVAGDFYDIFPLADGRYAIVVADVSDKGAPAAMYMGLVYSRIRAFADRFASPAGLLKTVNKTFQAHASADMFVTIFYAILDPADHSLTYANAGHDPPLWGRATGVIAQLDPTGPLVGILAEIELTDVTITLSPGERLVAYTDGVTDAINDQVEMYGLSRLAATFLAAPQGAENALAHILSDLNAFTGSTPQFDDITLVVVAVTD